MTYKNPLEREGYYNWIELEDMGIIFHVNFFKHWRYDWSKSPTWNVWIQFGRDIDKQYDKKFKKEYFTIKKSVFINFIKHCRQRCVWVPAEYGYKKPLNRLMRKTQDSILRKEVINNFPEVVENGTKNKQ